MDGRSQFGNAIARRQGPLPSLARRITIRKRPRYSPGRAMNPVESPQVHLVLRAHAPSPARLGVVYQPFGWRLGKTVLALALFWGVCPWVVWLPPHYPWPVLCFCTGAFLAHRFWTGRYVVLWFAGECPRCGHALRLRAGA